MATRRTTAARKTGGRRKTTTRRRRSPARRKTTTRRRKTTRRKPTTRRRTTRRKSSGRRKTTTRRRRATRRKPTTRRRRTTRRKSSGRRKSTGRRRKSTSRRRRTSRRKPTTRRRRTSRRKSTGRRRRSTSRRRRSTARRKSGARRKSTARRRSGARALLSRRRGSKMSLKGFKSFVKDHLAGRALAVTALGLMLPAIGIYTAAKLNIGSMVSRVPVLNTVMGNAYGRAALGATVTAGLSYLAVGAGLLGRNEAIMANSIALVIFGLNAMRNAGHLPMAVAAAAPAASVDDSALFGYGGSYMNGYGGYLGYLGNAHSDEDDAPGELFGYSAAPQVNVF